MDIDVEAQAHLVLREDKDHVAWLTLNSPETRNALSAPMLTALAAALTDIAEDASVRVVVIQGAGPAYCAGHNLRELQAATRDERAAIFTQCSAFMLQLQALPQPTIASVHAIATAAGCQLVATCDLAIAAATAAFATPGVNIGLFCSTPAVAVSRAVSPKATLEMLLTGDPVSAPRAREIGLINRVVPDATLRAETQALANRIASKSPEIVRLGKKAFQHQAGLDRAEAYRYAAAVMTENMALPDAAEGIDAFLNRRPPVWSAQS